MDSKKLDEIRLRNGRVSAIENKVRKDYRADGYQNVLTKYGTKQDNTEAYVYQGEPRIPDITLTRQYETNGLFAKIIDTPAEEAVKHGFDLGIENKELEEMIYKKLDDLDFEEKACTAIKWARLYGGAVIVIMIDDGGNLDEPVNWKAAKGIDELIVYERAIVQPDYTCFYAGFGSEDGIRKTSNFGNPEYFYVSSYTGYFRIHESRLLIFKNGTMPEIGMLAEYRYWGVPEYSRIKRELRDTAIAHGDGVKLLERSVQPIYKMKNLSNLLATDSGEDAVLKRLQLIDLARGFMNSISIDADGEDYAFQSFSTTGVAEVINTTCNMLSAITEIPQTILFGRSPAGMNATGDSDMENYYNYVDKIRKLMLKHNIEYLVNALYLCEANAGKIMEIPDFKLEFKPLWNLTEAEQAQVDQTKAQTAQTKAYTAQIYIDMGALDPSEVRNALKSSEDYEIQDLIDEDSPDEIMSPEERSGLSQYKLQELTGGGEGQNPMMGGGMPPMMGGGMPVESQEESEDEEVMAKDDETSESVLVDDKKSDLTGRGKPSIMISWDEKDFKESEHPRDENGRFTSGASASDKSESPKKEESKEESKPVPKKVIVNGKETTVTRKTLASLKAEKEAKAKESSNSSEKVSESLSKPQKASEKESKSKNKADFGEPQEKIEKFFYDNIFSNGEKVKSFSSHSEDRVNERKFETKYLKKLLQKEPVQSNQDESCDIYQTRYQKMVFNKNTKNVVSMMYRGKAQKLVEKQEYEKLRDLLERDDGNDC